LRAIVKDQGSKSLVYIDETGFAPQAHRPRGWADRGQKVYGEHSGERRPRTSLIAAKWGKKLLAPFLFSGTTTADWFNQWLTDHLFPELPANATLIMDNAAFHKTPATKNIIEQSPFDLLYLPPYSPDFNPIEQDFANMKKRRQHAQPGTPIDDIVDMYNY
jgi:transposase